MSENKEISNKRASKVSKHLALILRHKPEAIGIKLDGNGWARMDHIMKRSFLKPTREEIVHVVETNDKQRYELSEDKRLIRALQGHSVDVIVEMDELEPPEKLYHGTKTLYLRWILGEKQGLDKRSRNHVHLSADEETAWSVGNRRMGETVVFEVDAKRMFADGHKFWRSKNGVWLCEHVQHEYITKQIYEHA